MKRQESQERRNFLTEASSLPYQHYVQKSPLQTCSPAGAGVRAGQGRWLLAEAGGTSQHISSGLSWQQPLHAPLLCCGFSVTTENLDILHLLLMPACVDGFGLGPCVVEIFLCSEGLKCFLNDWQGLSMVSKSHLGVWGTSSAVLLLSRLKFHFPFREGPGSF